MGTLHMSLQSADNISLTITHVLEHLFCPRFTYFEYVLAIPEHQEKRWKVQKGRDVHLERQKVNKSYLRKKLGVTKRELDVPLASEKLQVRGIADEVLTLDDGTMAPFDYKYAKAPKKTFRTHKYQAVLYGMLIEEIYDMPVNRAFVCYTRSNYQVVEIPISKRLKSNAEKLVQEVVEVITEGFLPLATPYKNRCIDCCYRKICIQ